MKTAKQIIATLLARLRCYEGQWSVEDRQAVAEAIEVLNTKSGERLVLNVGGVCDTCGEPACAHRMPAGECFTDEEREAIAGVLDRWHAAVRPARESYQLLRDSEKTMRRLVRRGRIGGMEAAQVSRDADAAWGRYQATIRRADRDAQIELHGEEAEDA